MELNPKPRKDGQPHRVSNNRKKEVFAHLQIQEPMVFTPQMVYDGGSLGYYKGTLDFGSGDSNHRVVGYCLFLLLHTPLSMC